MNEPTVIITGANGFIGESLVHHFREKNWTVRALVRNPPASAIGNVEYIRYTIEQEPDEAFFRSAHFLIHCAYMRFEKNKDADRMNIEGTKNLLYLCRKHGVKMVFLSSFSAHQHAESHYGKMKWQSEKVFDLSKDLVLRPGLVIGKKGLFGEIMSRIKTARIFPLVGGGNQLVQTIYIDDLCMVIEKALTENKSGLFTVAEPDPVTMKNFYTALAAQLHKKPYFFHVPISFLLWVCKLSEAIGLKLPVSSESVLGLKQLITVDTRKDLQALDTSVRTYKESFHALLAPGKD